MPLRVVCRPPPQACTFKVDYTLPTAPGLDFGSVFVGNGTENLALSVAAAGWAKVCSHPGGEGPCLHCPSHLPSSHP